VPLCVCVNVFITAVPIINLFAWGEGDRGGHVLPETTSRGLCGLVCPSRTSGRGVCGVGRLTVTADTWPRVAPQVSEFAPAERVSAELLARAVGQCLTLDHVAAIYFIIDTNVIWRQHADSSLVLFASAAELCYSMSVPEQDASCCAEFIAEHEEHGLCNVRVLESGRHVARYWKFWARSVLQELRDEACRLWAENQALTRSDGADQFEKETFEEQDKVLRSYFAQKGGTRGQRGGGTHGQGRKHVKWDMYV
jgi:hypothetical protein